MLHLHDAVDYADEKEIADELESNQDLYMQQALSAIRGNRNENGDDENYDAVLPDVEDESTATKPLQSEVDTTSPSTTTGGVSNKDAGATKPNIAELLKDGKVLNFLQLFGPSTAEPRRKKRRRRRGLQISGESAHVDAESDDESLLTLVSAQNADSDEDDSDAADPMQLAILQQSADPVLGVTAPAKKRMSTQFAEPLAPGYDGPVADVKDPDLHPLHQQAWEELIEWEEVWIT